VSDSGALLPLLPVVVVGAGQAGLATGFYLQRAGLVPHDDFVVLDAATEPGGAWPEAWRSLRLFSPAEHSSLPGRPMPPWRDGYPTADHVRRYLADYEQRYRLPVLRPVRVRSVSHDPADLSGPLVVEADGYAVRAEAVVSATGTWTRPFWPTYPGMRDFVGTQLHASSYRGPEAYAGKRVVVVGGGNTAAQVLAEVSTVADTTWVTTRPPRLMPDDVDGRHLFAVATRRTQAIAAGDPTDSDAGAGSAGWATW